MTRRRSLSEIAVADSLDETGNVIATGDHGSSFKFQVSRSKLVGSKFNVRSSMSLCSKLNVRSSMSLCSKLKVRSSKFV